jgi:beta-mannosidase
MTPSPEAPASASAAAHARARVSGHELLALSSGWQAAACAPGLHAGPAGADGLGWLPAQVPGTAAAVLQDAGLWEPSEPRDLDAEDWWFRATFYTDPPADGEELYLRIEGIATVAEVFLNGELVLESCSMFQTHLLDLRGRVEDTNELAIRCRALGPLLEVRRRPRARWRTRLVSHGNLRFFRTMLLGRAPGFAPGPAAVGPWRGISLERRRHLSVDELLVRPRVEAAGGVVAVRARLRGLDGSAPGPIQIELEGPTGSHAAELEQQRLSDGGPGEAVVEGELAAPGAARWWPHTHGEPCLYAVRLRVACGESPITVSAGRIGFRLLEFGAGPEHVPEQDGIDLRVNGVPVFSRGAVWTPPDAIGLAPPAGELRAELLRVREAGMNMVRLPGTGVYESSEFYDICDELGILVWQDFMFANLDYPIGEETFRTTVSSEVDAVLDAIGGRPSLAVLCGNSEVEQQVSMLGLDPALGRGALFDELLPAAVERSSIDAAYVPSAPCGGALPFWPDRGIANYYGVGAYMRPLEDVRRSEVRFAAECCAFSNVPTEEAVQETLAGEPLSKALEQRAWKAGIPSNVEADSDAEDVRDYYLGLLWGVDARVLRRTDPERYLELSRTITGELMAEVLGEWRREGSPCRGALVMWQRDLMPGAGLGLVDHRGVAKCAYHHLKRALAPVAVWTVDEGLRGVAVHAANDGPDELRASLRVALYTRGEHRVEEACSGVALEPHSQQEWNVEALLGRFVDAAWAYRFGPGEQSAIVASLEAADAPPGEARLLSQAMRFPSGRPLELEPREHLGLTATALPLSGGDVRVTLTSRRLAYGVRFHTPGFAPSEDDLSIEPGHERHVVLRRHAAGSPTGSGMLSALNMIERIDVDLGGETP